MYKKSIIIGASCGIVGNIVALICTHGEACCFFIGFLANLLGSCITELILIYKKS